MKIKTYICVTRFTKEIILTSLKPSAGDGTFLLLGETDVEIEDSFSLDDESYQEVIKQAKIDVQELELSKAKALIEQYS